MPTIVVPDDFELLRLFQSSRSETAFAELVRRHGPMVKAVCRRGLGDRPEADDAFQAVFLVLARKASGIRAVESLGPWLHTVAVRTMVRVRAADRRRSVRERTVRQMPEVATMDREPTDWTHVLDEELQRLPDKFRAPLIVCELEGLSREQGAWRLNIPEGTLSSRLARGRELLRQRLVRRGMTVSMAALAATFAESAQASVPSGLISTTTTAALAGTASGSAAALAQGVMNAMFISKLKPVFFAALMFLAAAGAVSTLSLSAQTEAKADAALAGKLIGTWVIVEAGQKGVNDPNSVVIGKEAVIDKDTLQFRAKAKYRLDAAKKPAQIDMIVEDGPEVERGTWKGIVEVKGDTLRLCLALPSEERPSRFESTAAGKDMLLVMRQKK